MLASWQASINVTSNVNISSVANLDNLTGYCIDLFNDVTL